MRKEEKALPYGRMTTNKRTRSGGNRGNNLTTITEVSEMGRSCQWMLKASKCQTDKEQNLASY